MPRTKATTNETTAGMGVSVIENTSEHSDSLGNLAAAVITVMQKVKGIEKNLEVGTGRSSYKGVADKDVKNIIGAAMADAGLVILPVGVKSNVDMVNYQESDSYGVKQKRNVFVEVNTEYLLLHTSGEWVKMAGLGHGVDTQDKAAGKATTYALKYALLYAFLVPTGTIDDTDATNSADIPGVPIQKKELPDLTGSIIDVTNKTPITTGGDKDTRPIMTEAVFNATKEQMVNGNNNKALRQSKDIYDSAVKAMQIKKEYLEELSKLVK